MNQYECHIIFLTDIFLDLHNLSASAHFGAGNIVLEKNAERWIDSKMIMIIRQVWVLNWFLCYWFKIFINFGVKPIC